MGSTVINLPKKLPLLVVGNDVLLPGSSLRIPVSTPKNMTMVRQHLMKYNTLTSAIIGVMPKNADTSSNEIVYESDLHSIGTAAVVVQITGTNWPQPSYTLLVTGLCRFKLIKLVPHNPYAVGLVEQLDKLPATDDIGPGTSEPTEALTGIINKFKSKIFALLETLDISLPIAQRLKRILNSVPAHNLPDLCASIIKTSYSEKLEILDTVDLSERFEKMLPLLQRQIDAAQLSPKPKKILEKQLPFKQMTKRSAVDDGNEEEVEIDDITDLENKLNSAKLPTHVHKVAMKELQRLKKMMPQLPEYLLARTYLELIAELPWSNSSKQTLDINKARKDLDADHYAMDKVKKRVLEFLAVCQLKNSLKGPILCFVGPPGVGKTSIGRSIANTLGREFHRIALGGVCDQSDIRGHRRTYIGALPGRIIQGLRSVGVNNPVFLLDEIDKLSSGINGNPAAALLEVLDPEQNCSFTDHYLSVTFDLSQVLFIATANSIASIPPALLDRMEVIPVAGYMQEEKIHIAHRHLIPKQIRENGLSAETLTIPEESVKFLISRYTREAGVRSLERKIGALCRAVAVRVAENIPEIYEGAPKNKKSIFNGKRNDVTHPPNLPIVLDEPAIEDILGPPVYENEIGGHIGQPGVAIGLAWTPHGGGIMFIEATIVEGDGELVLTGQLGDVMKESAKIALNYVRSQVDLSISTTNIMKNKNVHIHFPSGAVGKDGPSAGITIVVVLVSLFTGRCVRSDLAMTGEVTLRGLILPVGGIKEKVLAAHRAGISTIMLPSQNLKDLHDIPLSIQNEITFVFVNTIEEALQNAFEGGFNVAESHIENIIPSNL